ncbi:Glutamate-rich WD repeat-containing protein 1 [Entamoeba marina]
MDKSGRRARKANRVNTSRHFINKPSKSLCKKLESGMVEENPYGDEYIEQDENLDEEDLMDEEMMDEDVLEEKEEENVVDNPDEYIPPEEHIELKEIKGDVAEDPEDAVKVETEVYIPNTNTNAMEEDNEELEPTSGAYKMLHSLSLEWSSLSFDIIPDNLGVSRTQPPHTVYFVTGTHAGVNKKNKVCLTKATNMCVTHEDSSSEDGDGDNENPLKPKMEEDYNYSDPLLFNSEALIPSRSNRCRALKQKPGVVSLWGEDGKVYIYDMSDHFNALEGGATIGGNELKQTLNHRCEGFALDFSPTVPGRLISGCLNGRLMLWDEAQGTWRGSPDGFNGHKKSIEDLQWSPNEADVFTSCSSDKTIRLWDARQKSGCVKSIKAHDVDVNVISWNKLDPMSLVSGGDDGIIKVWDFRMFDTPTGIYDWHKRAITSIEWSPHDQTTFIASSEDDTITFWDVSMEADREVAEELKIEEMESVPPQLMFLHQGQKRIKEVHWHPQIPGLVMSTAWDGMNIFQPCNF